MGRGIPAIYLKTCEGLHIREQSLRGEWAGHSNSVLGIAEQKVTPIFK